MSVYNGNFPRTDLEVQLQKQEQVTNTIKETAVAVGNVALIIMALGVIPVAIGALTLSAGGAASLSSVSLSVGSTVMYAGASLVVPLGILGLAYKYSSYREKSIQEQMRNEVELNSFADNVV